MSRLRPADSTDAGLFPADKRQRVALLGYSPHFFPVTGDRIESSSVHDDRRDNELTRREIRHRRQMIPAPESADRSVPKSLPWAPSRDLSPPGRTKRTACRGYAHTSTNSVFLSQSSPDCAAREAISSGVSTRLYSRTSSSSPTKWAAWSTSKLPTTMGRLLLRTLPGRSIVPTS